MVLARLAIDVVVVGGLVWWSVVGPLTDDDGFAAVIARQIGAGDVGNYYRWFDASEAPFASGQRVLSLFLDQGLSPVALRTPCVLAGIALWFVLTRGVLRPALGPVGRSVAVRAMAAAALAVWWLPYDLGTRPEPLVALGSTTVTALVLRAARAVDDRGRRARHPVALIAVAALVAGLTVTVAPSGLIAGTPFLLCLPRLLRAVGGAGPPREEGRVARVTRALAPLAHLAVIAGLAAVAVSVVFTHQSWHGVLVATEIHQQIGPDQPWYAEWLRYSYLFGQDSWGSAAKRVPVIVGLVLAGVGVLLLVRGTGPAGVLGRESALLLGSSPTAFALLAVTPSKWSHHFGALAGFGAVGIVAVAVALWRVAPRRDPVVAGGAGLATLALAFGAAFAFAAPNAWWAYSGFGVPGSTAPQRPFDSAVLWLLVAVVLTLVASVSVHLRRGRKSAAAREGRDGASSGTAARARHVLLAASAVVPALTSSVVVLTSLVLLVSSFAAAADQGGRYSLAAQNRTAIADPTSPAACGLQGRVQVLQTVPGGPLAPVSGSVSTTTGFVADGGAVDPPPLRPGETDGSKGTADTRAGRYTWGSRADGDGSVGDLTTAWFGFSRPGADQELALDVAGRTVDGESVSWEFGKGSRVLGSRPIIEPDEPDRGYRGYAADTRQQALQDRNSSGDRWRTITLAPGDIPAGADRVRLRAVDDRTDTGGWVALTGPRVVGVVPLDRWLAGHAPVLVDWAVALAWPCAGALPRLADGLAQTPGAFVTTPTGPDDPAPGDRMTNPSPPGDIVPERWTLGTDGLATSQDSDASFAGLTADGSLRELDTRLPDEPGRRWGRVLVPDLEDLDTDAYDVTRTVRAIPGAGGDPPPVVDPPAGAPPEQSSLR